MCACGVVDRSIRRAVERVRGAGEPSKLARGWFSSSRSRSSVASDLVPTYSRSSTLAPTLSSPLSSQTRSIGSTLLFSSPTSPTTNDASAPHSRSLSPDRLPTPDRHVCQPRLAPSCPGQAVGTALCRDVVAPIPRPRQGTVDPLGHRGFEGFAPQRCAWCAYSHSLRRGLPRLPRAWTALASLSLPHMGFSRGSCAGASDALRPDS